MYMALNLTKHLKPLFKNCALCAKTEFFQKK